MTNFSFQHPNTVLLHGGQQPDPTTGARAVPIYQTTSFVFNDTEHAQNLFGLTEPGNIYTRIGNPTVDAFEQRVALLEDGVAAVAASSGMAAITLAILNLAGAGDEIIADSNLYGGTFNLFANTLPNYGIDVKFVDGTDLEQIRQAITPKTKAIFAESITNPSLYVFDVEEAAKIAHAHNIPLIIDNTFAPYFFKPLTWGADIVIHSATKWIGGHGTAIGGVIVDGGRFNWNHERFPAFTTPDESYNGLRYVDAGPQAFAIKLRVQLLRDIGACLSPQNAFTFLQGLETLHLRIEKHAKNAEETAAFLADHPAVEWVNYPGLPDHPSHQLAKKYFNQSFGSMITFGIKGGREAGRRVIDEIKLWSHVANVGDAKSLIIHPATTTHQQLSAEDLKKSGVSEELIRLSIGLESTTDILRDLDQAIAKATGESRVLEETEADVISWLLESPFDRSAGAPRRKTIVTYDAVTEGLDPLKRAGFDIITIGNTANQSDTVYATLAEVSNEIDVVLLADNSLSEEVVQAAIQKQVKIIWTEQANTDQDLLSKAKAEGISVISNHQLVEAFEQQRNPNWKPALIKA
ncbi:aminotransferase class I/II-fold pyridoxal phosphate-dependent enzyme [Ornithinibacillus gellani]|uniref:PLP-dependent aspartate aminotransferase family protein n=1 Tax=Ornithinibacillus gellani TaxID=2293253 RepID=UPI000F46304A|nr:PLP-dependent aspartate aminotransferase family protein [Ornithinibacillus gellani]TQS72080.1 aminotransferase class I/II-fold pyridoxal phosphate-dependent enzyme [Ornithinibacillus gellani]